MTDKTIKRITDVGTKLVIFVLCGSVILAMTYFGVFFLRVMIKDLLIRRILNCVLYVAMGGCALIAMKLSGYKLKGELGFGEPRQYLWGAAVFAPLCAALVVIPMLLGGSIVGGHMNLSFGDMVFYPIFYLVFVGPVEELIFRQYIQGLLEDILPCWKWLGAVIAAAVFGVWHLVNGSGYQALFSGAIGLTLGLAKYFIKKCTLLSTALAHGLYDLSIIVFRATLI